MTMRWVGLALAVALTGCHGGKGEKRQPPAAAVLYAPVVKKAVPLTLDAIGTVEASSSVLVRALATGELKHVTFKEGQPVKQGQLLFEIDPAPARAALAQAEAQLARDRVNANQARSEARRYAGLLRQGFVAREQAEQLAASANALGQTLEADEASVASARIQLGYTAIHAPIDGVVGALQVTAGNLVKAADQTPLVVIHRVHPIYVSFAVPEAQVDQVKRFQSAKHQLPVVAKPKGDGAPARGSLTFLDHAVDATTGTWKLRGTFANADERLVPGQYVDATLELDPGADTLTVPAQAIQNGQQGTFVWVIGADDTVAVRPVEVGRLAAQDAVITKGLTLGEHVVTDGQLALVPGATVKRKGKDRGGADQAASGEAVAGKHHRRGGGGGMGGEGGTR